MIRIPKHVFNQIKHGLESGGTRAVLAFRFPDGVEAYGADAHRFNNAQPPSRLAMERFDDETIASVYRATHESAKRTAEHMTRQIPGLVVVMLDADDVLRSQENHA